MCTQRDCGMARSKDVYKLYDHDQEVTHMHYSGCKEAQTLRAIAPQYYPFLAVQLACKAWQNHIGSVQQSRRVDAKDAPLTRLIRRDSASHCRDMMLQRPDASDSCRHSQQPMQTRGHDSCQTAYHADVHSMISLWDRRHASPACIGCQSFLYILV